MSVTSPNVSKLSCWICMLWLTDPNNEHIMEEDCLEENDHKMDESNFCKKKWKIDILFCSFAS